MPKILRIINRFNIGGPTYNAAILTKYLSDKYDTKLVGGAHQSSENSSNFILESLDIKGEVVRNMRRELKPLEDRAAYREIKEIIKKYQPDIIHTHASKAGAIGRAAGIHYGKAKMVHTFHGHVFHSYFGKIKTTAYKTIERGLAKKTDKIIAISELQKEELVNTYKICSAEKVSVIPLGFDLSKLYTDSDSKRNSFRSKYQLNDDEIAIGIIGRLTGIKNHQLFLNAFELAKKSSSNKIRAFIIGGGEDKEKLIEYCKQLNLSYTTTEFQEDGNTAKADVHFTSWIKSMDIPYAGIDIVALSSNNEGTPVSLIEAQAASKPIVSTEVGGIADIVIKNKTALLSNPEDLGSFTANLLKLIDNSSLRKSLTQISKDFVAERFHYNRLVRDIENLYDSILT